MLYDPDFHAEPRPDLVVLDKLLAKLLDCDLGAWDQDFVDDLIKRHQRYGEAMPPLTTRQHEQLERMKGQYDVDED